MTNSQRIWGLDLLRASAILFVVIAHGLHIIYPFFPNSLVNIIIYVFSFFGVEIFFVLSGFLIGRIFINLQTKENSIKYLLSFWLSRWFRTLPAYYIVLFFLYFYYYDKDIEIIPFIFFTNNLLKNGVPFFGVSWSLAVEEWFYVLLPISYHISCFIYKNSNILLISCIWIFIFTFIRTQEILQAGKVLESIRYITIYRLDSIMYGVLLAYIYTYHSLLFRKYKMQVGIVGIILFIISLSCILFGILTSKSNVYAQILLFPLSSVSILLIIEFL